ncbi:hypothetical protein OE88DRAFT_1668181 [Heliocybe sulcata]|uniref:Uncharacterized protein n=1 Tax=Heliocybe sulcata TaxID=5364 RepID=A0A5C3MMC0_9AGAM|nr:hypothetical protein OE88DRAFT_1668181 [Heliocybe sulcata]
MAKKSQSLPHTDAPPFLRFPTAQPHGGSSYGTHPRVRTQTLASASGNQRHLPPTLSLGHLDHIPASPYQMDVDLSRFSPSARDLLSEDPFACLSPGPDVVAFATQTQALASSLSPSMSTVTLQPTPRSRTPTPALSRCSSIEDSLAPTTPPAVTRESRSSFYMTVSEADSVAHGRPLSRVRTRPELKTSPSTTSLVSMVKIGKSGKGLFRRKAKTPRPQSPPEPCPSLSSCGSDDISIHSRASSYGAPRLPWLERVLSRPSTADKIPPLPPLPVRVQADIVPEVQLRPISRFDVDFDSEMDMRSSRMLA